MFTAFNVSEIFVVTNIDINDPILAAFIYSGRRSENYFE